MATYQEQIDSLVAESADVKLDLELVIKDTTDIKFIAYDPKVVIPTTAEVKVEWKTKSIYKTITHGGTAEIRYGSEFTKANGNPVPVLFTDLSQVYVDNNNVIVPDSDPEATPYVISEPHYWKELAWDSPLPISFKAAIIETINKYYDLAYTPLVKILDPES